MNRCAWHEIDFARQNILNRQSDLAHRQIAQELPGRIFKEEINIAVRAGFSARDFAFVAFGLALRVMAR